MPKFRALLKQQLFELLTDMFLEWLEVRERPWTSQRCSSCHQPYAFPDALYCAFCGSPLRATEPALCTVQFPVSVIQQQQTDALYLPPGTLARMHHQEIANGVGPHTSVSKAIRKVQLTQTKEASR